MPINVDHYEELAGEVLKVYEEAERVMMHRVARRLNRGITQPGWTERKYGEMREMQQQMTAYVNQLSENRGEMQAQFLVQAYADARAAMISDARTFTELSQTQGLTANTIKVVNIMSELETSMSAADRQILRKVNDEYAAIVGRASALVATGSITYREAVQRELDDFANRGITSFVDKAGRSWDMETYAEMATLTAIERATREGYLDTMQEFGFDLAVISDHYGACPVCEAWQNVVISVRGETPGYATLDDAEAAGVFHPRCMHDLGVYYEGITKGARIEPKEVQSPSVGYSVRSQQRGYERQIRRWKRRMAVASTPEEERAAYARVRMYQERLRDLIGEYNEITDSSIDHLPRKYWREGGQQKLSEAAKKLKPVQIPEGLQAKPVDVNKFDSGVKQTLKDRIESLKRSGGGYSVSEYIDAGKQVWQNVVDRIKNASPGIYDKIAALTKQNDAYRELRKMMIAEINNKYRRNTPEHRRALEMINETEEYFKNREVTKEISSLKKELDKQYQTALHDAIADLKQFGNYTPEELLAKISNLKSFGKAAQDVLDATQYYPKSWSNSVFNHYGKIQATRLQDTARAHVFGSAIYTTGDLSTSIHEFGHMIQDSNLRIGNAARDFFIYRTSGEKEERLYKVFPGRGYQRDEIAIKDHFLDYYFGKDYRIYENGKPQNNGRFQTELISMGYEMLYTGGANYYNNDPEMRDWLLGIIALED